MATTSYVLCEVQCVHVPVCKRPASPSFAVLRKNLLSQASSFEGPQRSADHLSPSLSLPPPLPSPLQLPRLPPPTTTTPSPPFLLPSPSANLPYPTSPPFLCPSARSISYSPQGGISINISVPLSAGLRQSVPPSHFHLEVHLKVGLHRFMLTTLTSRFTSFHANPNHVPKPHPHPHPRP